MSYFAPHCGWHGRRVLLGDSAISGLRSAPGEGIAIDFTCWCGWAGSFLPDGRTVAAAIPPAAPAGLSP